METGYFLDKQFVPSLMKLSASDSQRVMKAIDKYTKAPESPGLNLEQLEGRTGKRRLWTIRASQGLRVLLVRDGPTWVFLRAGHHDEIYDLAERRTFVVPVDSHPGLISIRPTPPNSGDSAPDRVAEPRQSPYDNKPTIVEHWTTGELARAGFSEDEIDRLRRTTQDTLLEVWPTITDEKLDRVIECSEMSPDEWFTRDLFADETDDESRHKRFRDAIVERGALAGLSSLLSSQELQRLMSAPIEDWMIFLHPDQRALVERRFSGPARVRGSAGTGKTVVALHRAAVLAKRFTNSGGRDRKAPPSILFTTFVRSLTPVLRNLYHRLPTSVAGAVEFVNVDSLASRICRQFGQPPRIDPDTASKSFEAAFSAVVRAGTPLQRAGLTRDYLREEVTAVLKGRGVDSLKEYLNLERTGRRMPFTAAMRAQAWTLREEWDKRLREAGIMDFPDVVREAPRSGTRSSGADVLRRDSRRIPGSDACGIAARAGAGGQGKGKRRGGCSVHRWRWCAEDLSRRVYPRPGRAEHTGQQCGSAGELPQYAADHSCRHGLCRIGKPSTISATSTGAAMRTRWPCAKAADLVWCALATCLARLPM